MPPELVFDQRLGSVFAARIAGNFVNTDIIGSLEFATKVIGCQAGRGPGPLRMRRDQGCDRQCPAGQPDRHLSNIWPAVEATKGIPGERTSKNKAFVQAVAETNARLAARMLIERSPAMAGLVDAGA